MIQPLDFPNGTNDELIQVIIFQSVVRLNTNQAVIAAVQASFEAITVGESSKNPEVQSWLKSGARRICFSGRNEASLVADYEQAKSAHLPCAIAGLPRQGTPSNKPPFVALAIGPARACLVLAITASLSVLKRTFPL